MNVFFLQAIPPGALIHTHTCMHTHTHNLENFGGLVKGMDENAHEEKETQHALIGAIN